MIKKVWFQIGVAILLAILIIKFSMEIKFIFRPLNVVVQTILMPVIFGGALYYLTEPLQRKLEEKRVPRWASILIILLSIAVAITIVIMIIAPKVTEQVNNLVENLPAITERLNEWRLFLMEKLDHLPTELGQTLESALSTLETSAGKIGSKLMAFIQSVSSAVVSLVLVPFFFIFMLKDHEKFAPLVYGLFKGNFRNWLKKTLYDIDQVLRSYIQGQMIISAILATLLFIGYYIIGLEYALLLAIFALFMNIIPFLGPWIAFVPAVTIAFFQDPTMVIWVSIITLVAQQIDSNLITPNVMGKSLDIHPLTVITLLLTAGSIAGFFGILLAIPAYAVAKVIIRNIYLRREVLKEAVTGDVKE